ncbi:MAG: phosphatidate cytidylyltransferase [Anaerolineales bacterium]
MLQRVIVTLILVPLAIILIYFGGYVYQAAIITLLIVAAWEYIKLLRKINLQPAVPLVIAGVALLALIRSFFQFSYSSAILAALTLGTAAYYIGQLERDSGKPAVDFGASLSIILYIGFLGSYLISLRALPNGRWWTFLILPVVWIADSGAYLVGTYFGKHKIAPKTSPNKTWEGYWGGVLTGTLSGIGLTHLYQQVFNAGIDISLIEGALIALIISVFITLGDLTESMIKRQASCKDSGTLFPGHGGIFDRIDSLIWAGPIGYYLVLYIFLQ